jgi:hypothetical protein
MERRNCHEALEYLANAETFRREADQVVDQSRKNVLLFCADQLEICAADRRRDIATPKRSKKRRFGPRPGRLP